jgi:predicted DNA-binding transcriptional regulator YafY
MKITENLHRASVGTSDSLFTNNVATTKPKQTIRLNIGRAEKALRRHARQKEVERVRRGPLERMFKIHQIIADKKYPNAMQLADKLETCHKTICRDIEYMRDIYLFPIEYDFANRGYFYSKPVDGFPGAPGVTESKMFALLVAHKAVAQYRGTPFRQPLRLAFQKLSGQLDSKERYSLEDFGEALSFRPFAPEDTDLQLFELVTRARRHRRVLEFHYRKPGEKETETRRVHPYHLTCCDNRRYLLAWDEARSDVRTFALGRMQKPTICEERFNKPHSFDPNKYLKGSFTVMKGEGDYEVVIEFDAWATDQLRGRQWHATQQITELPGGGCRLTMRLTELEEVKRWILSWGTHATVITPSNLIDSIAKTISDLGSR